MTTIFTLTLVIVIINIISANGKDPDFSNSVNDKKEVKPRGGRYVAVDLDAVYRWREAHRKVRSIHNPKEIIDSAEIDRNAPVEDFEDYSVEVQPNIKLNTKIIKTKYTLKDTNELNAVAESFDEPNETFKRRPVRKISSMKDFIKSKKLEKQKQKRSLALYNGKQVSEETVDLLNSISKDKPIHKAALKNYPYYNDSKSFKMIAAKDRSRRNKNNIIEEENLATTISGFKFTGRPSFLNTDIAFKNIHE